MVLMMLGRQIHIAEPSVPVPSCFDVETDIKSWKDINH